MIESGLNIRSEARILYNMQLIGSRHETDVNDNVDDEDQDKEVLRDIDFHSVRHLFVLISMCYSLTLILSIFEQILFKLTHRHLPDNMIRRRTRINNAW